MSQPSKYAQAGVDIDAGDRVKKRIVEMTRQTHNERVLHRDGAFGALFSMAQMAMERPVLVSSVDGVGTKVKVAIQCGMHRGIGEDIVNHCVNDILTCGARPLFFLDYFACGRQNDEVVLQLIDGMSHACKQAGMALVGGETAQMPDVYAPDEYDIAGTIVGIVDEAKIIDGRGIRPGDVILGLPASGLHTNGYTLARKVLFEEAGYTPQTRLPELSRTVGEELLIPHQPYLHEVEKLRAAMEIKGIAHITGGGFEGNIHRALPDGVCARIRTHTWTPTPIFQLIHKHGHVSQQEMYRVFNMGIGIVLILAEADEARAKEILPESVRVGEIVPGQGVEMVW